MSGWLAVQNANRYSQMYIKGFLDISGGNLILRNNNLFINGGDASMNGNLYVAKTAYLQKTVCLGDLSVNGNLSAAFKPNSIDPAAIIGGIPASTGIYFTDISANYGLSVKNNTKLGGNLTVLGKTFLYSDVSLNGNLYANSLYENGVSLTSKYAPLSNPTFSGTINMGSLSIQKLQTTGDISANGNIYVKGNIYAGTSLYEGNISLSTKYATLASPAFTGIPTVPAPDLNSSSTQIATTYFARSLLNGYTTLYAPSFISGITTPLLTATSDASLNTRLAVGGDTIMGGALRVGKTLSVTGDISLNSRLLVNSDASLNGRLFVNSDVSMNNNLDISGSIIAHNNVNVYGVINQYTTSLGQGYIVNYPSNLTNASGDISANGIILGKSTNGANTLLGINSGNALTSGINNTCLGYSSGSTLTTGSNNIVIGTTATSSSSSVSNEITLGNSSISTLRCQATTITSLSDSRDKKNIEPLSVGIDFIDLLNPVKFNWNTRDGSKVGATDFGFIAQDLQQAQMRHGITVPNLVYDLNPDRLEASYATLIPIMVKSIQDLKVLVEQQQTEIDELKKSKF